MQKRTKSYLNLNLSLLKIKEYISATFNRNSVLTNPFFLYVVSFISALILYRFYWIDYPALSLELGIFIGMSLLIAFLLGSKTVLYRVLISPDLSQKRLLNYSMIWMAVVLVGFLITFIHSGTLLEKMVFGESAVNYKTDYGTIRYFTRFIKVLNAVGAIFFLHFYFSFKKKRFLIFLFLCIVPIVFLFNRFYAFNVILPLFLVSFFHLKLRGYKFWSSIIAFSLLLAFVFGIAGNIREKAKKADVSVLYDQLASDKYPEWLHKDFIWVYFYVSSPVAKLEYTISDEKLKNLPNDYPGLVTHALVPSSLGVRLNSFVKSENRFSENGYPSYYVGTSYHDAFCYAGWWGMIIMLGVLFIPIYLCLKFCVNKENYWFSIPTFAVLNMMFLLIPFGNVLVMTTTNAILYVSIACGFALYRASEKKAELS